MNKPFFSIVIPTYNRANIILKTIGSVINQTYPDWELIVVDDGSKDNTREVIQSISDARVNYIFQDNAERSEARNNGIRNARGQYICFLDSDDWYEPEHLEVLFKSISEKAFPVALFFTNCYYYQNEQIIKPEFPDFFDPPIYLLHYPVIPARVCVHADILKSYKFRKDIVIVEDQALWVTIAYKYPVYYIPEFTVVYHLHEDNSVNIKNNCFRPRLNGLRLLFKQHDVGPLIPRTIKRKLVSDCYYGISKHYFYRRKFFRMIFSLACSFIYRPFGQQNKIKLFMVYAYIFRPGKINEVL